MFNISKHHELTQATSAALPAIQQCLEIEQFIDQCQRLDRDLRYGASEASEFHAVTAQQLVSQHAAMEKCWKDFNRPATPHQIDLMVGLIVAAFPSVRSDDLGYFTQQILEEVAVLQPSMYVLSKALSAIRRKYEFLSIKTVVDEVQRVQYQARGLCGFDYWLSNLKVSLQLAEAQAADYKQLESKRKKAEQIK